jgi:hypothetical protein
MFNLAINSKLRGCDIMALKVGDVAPNGYSISHSNPLAINSFILFGRVSRPNLMKLFWKLSSFFAPRRHGLERRSDLAVVIVVVRQDGAQCARVESAKPFASAYA